MTMHRSNTSPRTSRRAAFEVARSNGGRARPWLLASLLLALLTALLPTSTPAQTLPEVTATPEDAARLYLRSLRAIRWDAAAQFIHPATLARFRGVITSIAEADSTGRVRGTLTGTDSVGYAALAAAEVFRRAIGTMIDSMPGLMNAIYDRDDRILGHVVEGADSAHVVYRTTARISGAVSEVKVMQLSRTDGGWRVRWSDEMQVLDTALRGFARPTRPPPPPAHDSTLPSPRLNSATARPNASTDPAGTPQR